MKKGTKIVLLVAASMIVFGGVLAAVSFFASGGNIGVSYGNNGWRTANDRRNGASSYRMITESQEFIGVTSIQIDTDMARVELRPGNTSKITVDYSYPNYQNVSCSAQGGRLVFSGRNNDYDGETQFFNFNLFGINPHNWVGSSNTDPYVIVTYPSGTQFSTVSVDTAFGDIRVKDLDATGEVSFDSDFGLLSVENLAAGTLDVDISSGETTFRSVTANSIELDSDFGSVEYTDITTNQLKSETSSGETRVFNSALGDAYFRSDFGTIKATDISTTSLEAQCSSGDMRFSGTLRGVNTLDSDFGTVIFSTTLSKADYDYDVSVDFGSFRLDGDKSKNYERNEGSANSVTVSSSSGDVELNFGD